MKKLLFIFISIIIRLIAIPPLLFVTLLDKDIAERILSKRFTIRDITPHFIVIILWVSLYIAYYNHLIILNIKKINEILPIIMSFQGVLFAAALTVSTFILTIFKPNDIKKRHPEKEEVISDIVDDLRIANRILFFSMLYVFSIWLIISLDYLQNSIPLTNSIFVFLVWSIIGIDSIIRGVFLLVKVE